MRHDPLISNHAIPQCVIVNGTPVLIIEGKQQHRIGGRGKDEING
jgi:hypothetical protein